MTIRDLIQWLGGHPWLLVTVFLALPAIAWLLPLVHGRSNGAQAAWRYAYSLLVYLACVPGMCSAVLTAYALFFRNENLLDANLLVYALLIVSMTITLVFVPLLEASEREKRFYNICMSGSHLVQGGTILRLRNRFPLFACCC